MKLTKLAVLLSGAALSASALAADPYVDSAQPLFNVDESKPATKTPARIGDENDTSWVTPQSRPLFSGSNVSAADHVGLPNDLDENAIAYGNASHGTTKHMLAGSGHGAAE